MQHFRLDTVPSSWVELFSAGRRITSIAHNANEYWHTEVWLEFDDGSILRAFTNEHCPAPMFDCFTLVLESSTEVAQGCIPFLPEFEIGKVFALVRDEWLVPAPEIEEKTIGSHPQIHASGRPGSATDRATVLATILSGVLLVSRDGRQLAITAATDVPLNVDVVSDAGEVEEIVDRHECWLLGAEDVHSRE